jgi:hypothetical protein
VTVKLSTLGRNAAGNSIVDLIDLGSTNLNGYLEIWTGSKPTNPQAAATGTRLARCSLSNPAYGDFTNGQALSNPIGQDTDLTGTGVAGWFRIYNRDNVPIFDGDVTGIGLGGDLEFDNVNFVKGGTVVINSLNAVMPE